MSTTPVSLNIKFNNSYASLAPEFYQRQAPTPVSDPSLIQFNDALSEQLGLDSKVLRSEAGLGMLSGNCVAAGADPIAMAYAGHQFGNWVPQLGDGRALLLGEIIDTEGVRQDIQLKGAGRTPFSRGGDGRNWMGPVLREYVVSEAMAALGVATTRALAAVKTGDSIMREHGPVPGAILTRVARCHIRVGTFQYFAARENLTAIKQLTAYVIDRYYPAAADQDSPALALLESVINAQASLVSHWQSLGFIHGVMNTDNCSISGDTIDYGPCAFMDSYSADKVFSSIDRGARYAYQNQPRMAQWNLVNLAQCLLPLIHDDQDQGVELAQQAINRFDEVYVGHYLTRMRAKLGLNTGQANENDDDLSLVSELLKLMEKYTLDFTLTFRQLAARSGTDPFAPGGSLHDWQLRWKQRIEEQAGGIEQATQIMQACNPVIIPRNHQLEALIDAAILDKDYGPFQNMLEAVSRPYDTAHEHGIYTKPPIDKEIVTQTFCGT